MNCSRLFGSVLLSLFLFSTFVIANDRVGEVIKPGDENHPKQGLYNKSSKKNPTSVVNTGKNPSDVIKGKDASEVIKGTGSIQIMVPEEGMGNSVVSAGKSKEGEILRKEGSIVEKAPVPISDLQGTSAGIEGGVLKAKQGEVLRKEGSVVKASPSTSNDSHVGVEGGVLRAKEGEVLRKDGTVFNKDYNRHSTFKINTRF